MVKPAMIAAGAIAVGLFGVTLILASLQSLEVAALMLNDRG